MILRFAIVVSFFLSLAAAFGSFSLFNSYQSERSLRLEAESKMIQVQDSSASSKAELEQQLSKINDLEAEREPLNAAITSLKTQVSSQSEKIAALEENLKNKEAELKKAMAKLNAPAVVKPAAPVPASVPSAVVAPAAPVQSVKPAAPVASSAPAPAAQESQVIPAEAPDTGDSRILTVNRKFNFIVVNLGLKDGLRMGDKVEVMQDGSQKALAQVEKIYDKFSAATLLSEDKGNPVHEGDTIRKL